MHLRSIVKSAAAAASAAALAACAADRAPTFLPPSVSLQTAPVPREAQTERVEICKDYVMKSGAQPPATTTFSVKVGAAAPTNVVVPTGGCVEAVLQGGASQQVTVTETVPDGFTPSYIQTTDIGNTNQPPVGPINSETATGMVGGSPAIGELFEFTNTEEIRGKGCTLTQGYWKTHSARGPAPYDNAWLNIGPKGADELFFASGKTWYQVFWTPPKGGNANYQLAHQYMAAKLNILAGASTTPAVDAAISGAEGYFPTVTNLDNKPTGSLKNKLQGWADTLDDYNNGLIGPGHCN